MQYVIYACNEIHETLLSTLDPSCEQLAHVFTVACNVLKELSIDPDFSGALDRLTQAREMVPDAFAAITEVDHFVHGFLVIERKVLAAAGLSDKSIDHLLRQATNLRDRIRQPAPSKAEIMAEIVDTRADVCLAASTLQENAQATEDAKRNKDRLKRVAFALGGAAMIFADASVIAVSVGMSAAGSAVSGAAGTAIITYGLTPSAN